MLLKHNGDVREENNHNCGGPWDEDESILGFQTLAVYIWEQVTVGDISPMKKALFFLQSSQEALKTPYSVTPFAVCKQDVSENLIIPQSSSFPKQSQNLALSKSILTDAKDLGVTLLSERCASPPGTQCNSSWTKRHFVYTVLQNFLFMLLYSS